MSWDDELWRKLKDAISPMPPFIRKKALKIIIEASERLARERSCSQVEEQDLVKAALEEVPFLAGGRMLAALAEQGIQIEVPDEKA